MTVRAADIVTLVIPVHNRADLVGDLLAAVNAQTVKPSVVLVDNNSTDTTREVLEKWATQYPAPVKVLVETIPGAAAARNRGLENVVTPYIMFFDSDDMMSEHHVERFVEAVTRCPDVDIVGWNVVIQELDGTRHIAPFASTDMWFRHIFNAILSTQRYGVKTSLMRSVGGWNSGLLGWNDFELGFRLLAQSPRVMKLTGEPTVTVRRQMVSITGTTYSASHGRWESSLRQCYCDILPLNDKKLERWLRLRWAVLAALYAREGAKKLADDTMTEAFCGMSCYRHVLLRFAYHYTRLNGRGIHYIMRRLL